MEIYLIDIFLFSLLFIYLLYNIVFSKFNKKSSLTFIIGAIIIGALFLIPEPKSKPYLGLLFIVLFFSFFFIYIFFSVIEKRKYIKYYSYHCYLCDRKTPENVLRKRYGICEDHHINMHQLKKLKLFVTIGYIFLGLIIFVRVAFFTDIAPRVITWIFVFSMIIYYLLYRKFLNDLKSN